MTEWFDFIGLFEINMTKLTLNFKQEDDIHFVSYCVLVNVTDHFRTPVVTHNFH